MKLQFTLGLILPIATAVAAISAPAVPVKLNEASMGAAIEAAGSAQVDPTLTCTANYTLTLDCTVTPCTISVTALDISNCTLTTP